MENWETVFSSYSHSGVYDIDQIKNTRRIRKEAFGEGLDYTFINLKNSCDKSGFLKTVASALKFPSYFGMNWDALNDCLTDLSWKKATGYVIILAHFGSVSENMAVESEIIKSILAASAEYWKKKKVQFYIILSA
jgi:RNAse (barnase) inhibitor barstar